MALNLENKAKEAFIDDHFELAVDLYSQAIEMSPKNAELFADRAQANIKLGSYTEAVADANRAIELNPSLVKAYLRKATACMKLEEYQTAKVALDKGSSLDPGNTRITNLIKDCEVKISVTSSSTFIGNNATVANAPQPTLLSSAKPKYRHEYYQKSDEVVVNIFAKGVPANSVTVDYGEQILSVRISVPGQDAYILQPRLFGKIIPEKCRYEVLSTKIEVRLAKAEDISWPSLEFNSSRNVITQAAKVSSATYKPSYPSSKPKRVDWDKLEAEVKKEEKEEKLDGDAALNKFFKDIYKDADEDTRRAMQKSFTESSGTVLSTNWKEVGSKKVEGSPPDGMEVKKWEY
ncbi:protein SGT1 homolog isoform X2 [Impatiens glandulifera]|uniref:protein SGT1 homolog isoform X2 n=1 Tax=Impatiens glandulifera TaxID=253017 RepID=UPI001FB14530|nr:protein SGT1 homolog isoform X2 [Impatiens glandulifera]